ncbi:helix-turn-helix domain-containing protein [Paenibacillus rhizoplanae]
MTPVSYITKCRIQTSKQLLLGNPSMSIKEVAIVSGYPGISYFNKNSWNPKELRQVNSARFIRRRARMALIHYVECNTTHASNFVVDVPAGAHWLLVITKTPALFWVHGGLKQYPAHSVVLYQPQQKVYYQACAGQFINDWIRF